MIPSIIIGLIASVGIIYYIWTKHRNQKPQADTDTSRPSTDYIPTQKKQNDKLVIVKDGNYTDFRGIITGFCNLYNKELYQAQPRLTKLTEREFAVTFPFDVEFEIFCYFINYVHYPIGFDKISNVTGWTTTKPDDSWITEKTANKKVMLFIPSDDSEHDNVFMTTIENIGFKLGFGMDEGKQLPDGPKKKFSSPTIDILQLENMEHEDFK